MPSLLRRFWRAFLNENALTTIQSVGLMAAVVVTIGVSAAVVSNQGAGILSNFSGGVRNINEQFQERGASPQVLGDQVSQDQSYGPGASKSGAGGNPAGQGNTANPNGRLPVYGNNGEQNATGSATTNKGSGITIPGDPFGKGIDAIKTAIELRKYLGGSFTFNPSGYIGVRGPDTFRLEVNMPGDSYSQAGGVGRIGDHLVGSASSGLAFLLSFLVSLVVNGIDFSPVGKYKSKGWLSREFFVSFGVDGIVGFIIGIVAAAIVAFTLWALSAILTAIAGVAVTVSLPAVLIVLAVAAVGLIIGLVLDHFGVTNWIKNQINNALGGNNFFGEHHMNGVDTPSGNMRYA